MATILQARLTRRRRRADEEEDDTGRVATGLDLTRVAFAGQGPIPATETLAPGGVPATAPGTRGGRVQAGGVSPRTLHAIMLGGPAGQGRAFGLSDLPSLTRGVGDSAAFVQLGNMAEALLAGDAVISGGQFIHAGSELALAGIEAPAVAGASGMASWAAANVFPILGAATATGLAAYQLAEGNEEAGIGGFAGMGAGAAAGAAIGSVFPGIGTAVGALVGAGVGGAVGGAAGGLFAPGAPLAGYKAEGIGFGVGMLDPVIGPVLGALGGHWIGGRGKSDAVDPAVHAERERKELGRTRGQARGLLGEIGQAATDRDLWTTLGRWGSGYVGGTSSQAVSVQARWDGLDAEGVQAAVTRGDLILPTRYPSVDEYLREHPLGPEGRVVASVGQPNAHYAVWSDAGFFRTIQAHPEWLAVSVQAGVQPGMLGPLNEGIRQGILTSVQTRAAAGRAGLPLTPSMLDALQFPAAQAFLREHFPTLGATG